MEEPKEKVTAIIIEYNYSVEDFDICSGYRTHNYAGEALIVEHDKREVVLVYYIGKVYFFPIMERMPNGTIHYNGSLMADIPLPKNINNYKIVKKVQIDKQLAKDVVEMAWWIDPFIEARRKATSFLLSLREKK